MQQQQQQQQSGVGGNDCRERGEPVAGVAVGGKELDGGGGVRDGTISPAELVRAAGETDKHVEVRVSTNAYSFAVTSKPASATPPPSTTSPPVVEEAVSAPPPPAAEVSIDARTPNHMSRTRHSSR